MQINVKKASLVQKPDTQTDICMYHAYISHLLKKMNLKYSVLCITQDYFIIFQTTYHDNAFTCDSSTSINQNWTLCTLQEIKSSRIEKLHSIVKVKLHMLTFKASCWLLGTWIECVSFCFCKMSSIAKIFILFSFAATASNVPFLLKRMHGFSWRKWIKT